MEKESLQKMQEIFEPKWMESITKSLFIVNQMPQITMASKHITTVSEEIMKNFEQFSVNSQLKHLDNNNALKAIEQIIGKQWAIPNEIMREAVNNLSLGQTKSYLMQWEHLESFKALSRLKDFPFNNTDYYSRKELLNPKTNRTVEELDSKISNSIKCVDSFKELTDENKEAYLILHANYYLPVFLNYLALVIFYRVFLDEKLNLSNYTFTLVEKGKSTMREYKPNVYGMIMGKLFMDASKSVWNNFFG